MTSAIVLLLSLHVAHDSTKQAVGDAELKAPATTYVIVENDRDVPLTVFADTRLGETELGYVAPHSSEYLHLEDGYAAQGAVDIFVDPKGQAVQHTGYQQVDLGKDLVVRVPKKQ